ncbi:discoidin domain-containing protein [Leifsonia shinshuensis]|uniref:polysaccharide lyase family 8 super-sandwich domain-containing protein n=1 Tax=Leifsonia shinshuensis TaxID=150026 RepID=UPI001F507B31|nr:polysaccharide lyase family 8 super-sandwich domain-containing protein [Leifsonia shinshuensis]MCI0157790.1 discoidin domain-containing protein [Leifsonia shinshuensis]
MTRHPESPNAPRSSLLRRGRLSAVAAFLLAAVLSAAGLAVPAQAADLQTDVSTIVSRLQDYYLSQGDEVQIANGIYLAQTSNAQDYVASQNADGSWSDVNYQDTTSSANGKTWDAYKALYRMVAIAQAYQDKTQKGYHDASLIGAEERALAYWDQVNPGNTNWWETEIGESIAMGRISIFVGDALSPDAAALAIKHNQGKLDPAGANGAWRTSDYLYKALATRDAAAISAGFATMVQTVAVDDSGTVQEAVQPDATFWAHGAQLYSEGYGMALFTMVAMWADSARGTSLAFTRDQLDTIAFYIIDGTRWLIRGELQMLYLLYRPATTVDGVTSYAAVFLDPLDRMARTDPLYATDYRELADNIRGKTAGNGAIGDTYFWRSEFSSHQRADYGIVTGLNSNRTVGSEYRSTIRKDVGNEVVWNRTGTTAIQVTNKEYTDLGPAFDWFHYPGTTVPYVKETTLGPNGRSANGGAFTGGVSDGSYGATVESLDRVGTQAQKSYYYFDDEMVALGSGIQSTSTAPIHTTVNQVSAKSNATVDGQKVAAGTDGQVVQNPSWAYNDKVGYVFPSGQPVTVSDKTQTGSYYGDQPESHDAFTLYFDHGTAPKNAGYEYIVLPAKTAAQTQAYAASPAVKILRNDTSVQAVQHAGLKRTMATFYQAGSLDLGDGRTLTVSRPSIVMLDESSGTPVVSLSNPSQPGLLVDVTLSGGAGTSHGTFVLGSGANLGKTVTEPLAADDPNGSPFVVRLAAGSYAMGADVDWGTDYASRYLVQTSTDGANWTDQKMVQNPSGGHQHVDFPATAANFVRVLPLDGPRAGSFSIAKLTPVSSVNLALGAPTTASDGTGPGSATDANLTTRWIADRTGSPDTSWLQVDLGTVQKIGAVRLYWEASYASQYKIQVSDDGTTWRDAYATPAAGSDGGTDLVALNATGRYVRMQTVKRALTTYGVSVWEFEVFGDSAITTAPTTTGRVNLAQGKPTTADSVYNNLANVQPTAATDGSKTTKWSSARPTGAAPYTNRNWLQVDLGSVQPVSQAVVEWETGNSTDYQLEGSVNGTDWTPLAHVQNSGTADHRRDTTDFAVAEVRYVRVIGSPSTKYGLNIWEFEVYGGYSLSCTAPVKADRDGVATATATITPVMSGDAIAAYSLDPGVAAVAATPQATADGRITVDLKTGAPGNTSLLIAHAAGDEFVWCPVSVAVDTTVLQALVERADGLDSTVYSATSWSPLIPALEAAKVTLKATGATQAVIDARASALKAALDGLKATATVGAADVTAKWGTAAKVTVTVTSALPVNGQVALTEGDTDRGLATLVDGVAEFTLPVGLAAGDHTMTATFRGSETVEGASASMTVAVALPAAWSKTTSYKTGDIVSYNGSVYKAGWSTKGEQPGSSNTGAWQELAMTESGAAVWTRSRVFNAGDTVVYQGKTFRADWYTRNEVPGSVTGPWEEIATAPDGTALWTPSRVFNAGDRASYNGVVYVAKWYSRNQAPGAANGPWAVAG